MTLLVIGLIIFISIHMLPSFVGLRTNLVERLGEVPYKGLFSLISLAGIIIIVMGKSRAEFQAIWDPPPFTRHLAMTMMLLALIMFVAADIKSNVKRYIRHPMLWGVIIWSSAHLLANGDLASIVLFGGALFFALTNMFSAKSRSATKQEIKFPISKDLIMLGVTTVAYVGILFLHPHLFGPKLI